MREEAILAIDHNLGCSAARESDHWRPTGHRFYHYQPKRFVPLQWQQKGSRTGIELALELGVRLAHELNVVAVDKRLDRLLVVVVLFIRRDLAGEDDTLSRPSRRLHGKMRRLGRNDAANEQHVIVLVGLEWKGIDVDTVMDD